MKKIYLPTLILLFACCTKEDQELQKPQEIFLFDKPITNWDLTKDEVKSQVELNLIEDCSAEDIMFLLPPFSIKGGGSLTYNGGDFFDEIDYGFYNLEKKLEVVFCLYEVSYTKTTEITLAFLKQEFGEYSVKAKEPNFSGFIGWQYKFNHNGDIVILDEYSEQTNRIIFTKEIYSNYY